MDKELFDQPEEYDVGLAASRRKEEPVKEGQLTIDVYQTDNEIVIRSTIAGVSADDLDISLTPEIVTIKGTRQFGEKVKETDYYLRELYWGAFSRSIILPEEIDVDRARASIKNGLLTLHLPKATKNKTKKLRIAS